MNFCWMLSHLQHNKEDVIWLALRQLSTKDQIKEEWRTMGYHTAFTNEQILYHISIESSLYITTVSFSLLQKLLMIQSNDVLTTLLLIKTNVNYDNKWYLCKMILSKPARLFYLVIYNLLQLLLIIFFFLISDWWPF